MTLKERTDIAAAASQMAYSNRLRDDPIRAAYAEGYFDALGRQDICGPAEEVHTGLWCVQWVRPSDGTLITGSPRDLSTVKAFVEMGNRDYPSIKHRCVPYRP